MVLTLMYLRIVDVVPLNTREGANSDGHSWSGPHGRSWCSVAMSRYRTSTCSFSYDELLNLTGKSNVVDAI